MPILDLFGSGEHSRKLSHFASIVNMATVHGEIKEPEETLLRRFARKLDISESEYLTVIENPTKFPIQPSNSQERRLERIHDLFVIIFCDHEIDEDESRLLQRYAIGLGFSSEGAEKVINRSIQIFSGKINIEDYKYLIEKER